MMSISTTRETYFGRSASEPTGRTPTAWAAGHGDDAQSATLRALAWSQEDDSAAEPLPYIGEPYQGLTVTEADTVEPPSATGYRRPILLYGIAAGFAAAAVAGLLLTVVNTDDVPSTISPKVTQPATNVVNSQPSTETAIQVGPIRASTPADAVGTPARAVPSTTAPARAFAPPAPELQTSSTPEVAAPESAVPDAAVPEVVAPEFTAPGAKPPVRVPPVISPPVVSVPKVTPQQVPHPIGPPVFHLPTDFQLPTVSDPAIPAPVAPAATNPVISLKPGVTIPVVIPTLSAGSGQ